MPAEIQATISLHISKPPFEVANALYRITGSPSEIAQEMEHLAGILRSCDGVPQAIIGLDPVVQTTKPHKESERISIHELTEAGAPLALIAAALSVYPNATHRFVPIDETTLSRIATYVSPNEDRSVSIIERRRQALKILRQEGSYSFDTFPPELQALAQTIQQDIAGLSQEQFVELMATIAPNLHSRS
ncbi:MAG: hypothetical protein NUV52_00750 [Candidatus Roizmanbacteria bacterium]|nr:hypothetical protein [Candidatus Roizmanbacteria bacterium]